MTDQSYTPTFGSRPLQIKNVNFEVVVARANGHKLPTEMAHTNATGKGLVTNGHLGGDLIRLDAGDAFAPHTHPGDHLIYVVEGHGTVTMDGVTHRTSPGDLFMVPGNVEHAVGAMTDHYILAIGAPHKAVDAPDRMTLVEPS